MDVYLGKDIIKVEKEDILNKPSDNKILMLRAKDIKNDPEIGVAVSNKEQYQIGDHTVVVLKGAS